MNATKIAALINATHAAYFGLRVVDETAEEGDQIAPSRVWVDGEVTDDVLDGASAIHIDAEHGSLEENIAEALARTGIYCGQYILVIAGNAMSYGEDDGEIIIRDAECLACWTR